MEISDIVEAIQAKRIRISDHADVEAHEDEISYEEVHYSVLQGQIIEEYPTDRPYPSCLVYGRTVVGDPVHSVWAFNPDNRWAVLVTVYRPDPDRWVNGTTRRRR